MFSCKIGFDTDENAPLKVCQQIAKSPTTHRPRLSLAEIVATEERLLNYNSADEEKQEESDDDD